MEKIDADKLRCYNVMEHFYLFFMTICLVLEFSKISAFYGHRSVNNIVVSSSNHKIAYFFLLYLRRYCDYRSKLN
jgi:hypothetical protein